MKNIPLTSVDVANLPIGFNITGYYPNRKMRRSYWENKSSSKYGASFYLQRILNKFIFHQKPVA